MALLLLVACGTASPAVELPKEPENDPEAERRLFGPALDQAVREDERRHAREESAAILRPPPPLPPVVASKPVPAIVGIVASTIESFANLEAPRLESALLRAERDLRRCYEEDTALHGVYAETLVVRLSFRSDGLVLAAVRDPSSTSAKRDEADAIVACVRDALLTHPVPPTSGLGRATVRMVLRPRS